MALLAVASVSLGISPAASSAPRAGAAAGVAGDRAGRRRSRPAFEVLRLGRCGTFFNHNASSVALLFVAAA
jgi:hypothetical protein